MEVDTVKDPAKVEIRTRLIQSRHVAQGLKNALASYPALFSLKDLRQIDRWVRIAEMKEREEI